MPPPQRRNRRPHRHRLEHIQHPLIPKRVSVNPQRELHHAVHAPDLDGHARHRDAQQQLFDLRLEGAAAHTYTCTSISISTSHGGESPHATDEQPEQGDEGGEGGELQGEAEQEDVGAGARLEPPAWVRKERMSEVMKRRPSQRGGILKKVWGRDGCGLALGVESFALGVVVVAVLEEEVQRRAHEDGRDDDLAAAGGVEADVAVLLDGGDAQRVPGGGEPGGEGGGDGVVVSASAGSAGAWVGSVAARVDNVHVGVVDG
ncbi:hypothetical protein EPUS_00051 [Endocarpon pusillum Z07020]|uniref:Uncharacterized protein n=1 Tax=Endocarpon pusillum (strain Z07020 / HMAS-L-300199) TaxID=1263415 RepID=U1I089_ENDPU|nr:uncharacterized protein EPUS_00051 [Endocarpon pusillum Z07020]ERF75259.1 hypothetical protein EPUS_00051 [Endocarpon pusillum Z07020]